ncbi:family 16 glycoside hydrolase [Haloferula rosea]|nr:family 16 glycoside hydrolase [Haloferula rosea]
MMAWLALWLPLGAEEIFNGKDLTGWEGDPKLWRVEDGMIVGETNATDKKLSANEFLIWKGGEVDDFDLSFKARVTGNNSGVQYRSERLPGEGWRMKGYQLDLHAKADYLGMLYEERGRGIACLRGQRVKLAADAEPEEIATLAIEPTDLSEWNEYRIVAKGHRLQHFVNGRLAVHVTDLDEGRRSMKGLIGLQLHAGPPMRVEMKDLVLKKAVSAPEPTTGPAVSWIWTSGRPTKNEKAFFRTEFTAPKDILGAELVVTADNYARVWVNGEDLGDSWDWSVAANHEIRKLLVPGGMNVIAVEARNQEGNAGMALRLHVSQPAGKKLFVVSNAQWHAAKEVGEGWQAVGSTSTKWSPATVVAKMGDEPWGMVIPEPVTGSRAVKGVTLLPDFELERLMTVPKEKGSWVSMAVDDIGRLICSDQHGGLYRVTIPPTGVPEVEDLPISLIGAQGLLWKDGALYVTVNEGGMNPSGVYRVESDGDRWGMPKLLKAVKGRGEHGPHSLVESPDGQWIYFCAGNMTALPDYEKSWVPEIWGEDQLLPRRPDGRGHARDRMAPGGYIARFKPDGSEWELIGIGFRNEYDLAFNDQGDLFSYDADMEWDLGMPWYRPTRINHVVPGAEFGWRNGTGKWPEYYEDSMPAAVDLGPGSPTGLLAGRGAAFPGKYQRAMYAFDWTYATVHAVHFVKEGETYTAEREEFLSGFGLPLTDAVIGKDGAMYFLTGGRRTESALWRVRYKGEESVAPVPYATVLPAMTVAKTGISSEDRTVRFRARTALELEGVNAAVEALEAADKPWEVIQSAMAVARLDAAKQQSMVIQRLVDLEWTELSKPQKLNWLRAAGLAFARGGAPNDALRGLVLGEIDAAYPAQDGEINAELCRMLCYLNAPGVVGRTLSLMDTAPPPVAPDWLALAERNSRYGGAVKKMVANLPPTRVIHYVYCLRAVPGPWERSERERFMAWLDRLETRTGGNSYAGFIQDLRKETLNGATPDERVWLDERQPVETKDPLADLPPVKGPGKTWTIEEVEALAAEGFDGVDRKNGERMFRAVLCAACHSFGGQGGAVGPDLSTLGGRFTAKDLAVALIEPSKEVSDQYAFDAITRDDGSQVFGRTLEEKDKVLIVAVNPFDFSKTVEVERSSVKEIKPSPISPMPGGLINRLNRDELRDLLGYLLSK